MKKRFFSVLFLIIPAVWFFLPARGISAQGLAENLSGRILIQVQQGGAIWYVNPSDKKRYPLGTPADSLLLIRALAVGVSNANLNMIPVADFNLASGLDSDADGLADAAEASFGTDPAKADTDGDGHGDKTEIINGYNPLGAGKLPIDKKFAASQRGRFFLQVMSKGEIWYINPLDSKRYLLSTPADLLALIKKSGLGITDANLNKIPLGIMPELKCDSLDCLAALAGACQSGEETDSLKIPFPLAARETANVNIDSKITGVNSSGVCSLVQQLRGGSISMSAADRLAVLAGTTTEAQLDSQISSINQILKSSAALNTAMTCIGTGADLSAYLSDMAGGLGGSDCLKHLGAPETDCLITPNLKCALITPSR